jgi:hypothetical protein
MHNIGKSSSKREWSITWKKLHQVKWSQKRSDPYRQNFLLAFTGSSSWSLFCLFSRVLFFYLSFSFLILYLVFFLPRFLFLSLDLFFICRFAFLYPSSCFLLFIFFYYPSLCLFVSTLPSIIRTFCERSLDDPQSFDCESNDQSDREWSEILAHIVAVRTNKWITKNCR